MPCYRSLLCSLAVTAVLAAGNAASQPRVYVKSDGLVQTWKSAGSAFADATYLKVYDEELTRLNTGADAQDLAIAKLGVARRDETIARVLAGARAPGTWRPGQPWQAGTAEADLSAIIQKEFGLLFGGFPSDQQLKALSNLEDVTLSRLRRISYFESLAVEERAAFERARPRGKGLPPAVAKKGDTKGKRPEGAEPTPPLDTSCDTLNNPATDASALVKAQGEAGSKLQRLITTCSQIAKIEASMEKTLDALVVLDPSTGAKLSGQFTAARQAAKDSQKPLTPAGVAELVTRLKGAIKAAEASGSRSQKDLATFRKAVGDILEDAKESPVAAELALQHLDDLISGYLRADVCSAGGDTSAELKAAASCDDIDGDSALAKAQAGWDFLEALAMLADATDPNTRSAPWLAGAKAIIAAAEADVRLQTEQAKGLARLRRENVRALLLRAGGLARAELALRDLTPGCERLACAVASFADSQDRGRIPSQILVWREIYLEREYGVRRERAAADKGRQLLQAAAVQMQSYVDGGVEPAVIAEALQALGLTLVALP